MEAQIPANPGGKYDLISQETETENESKRWEREREMFLWGALNNLSNWFSLYTTNHSQTHPPHLSQFSHFFFAMYKMISHTESLVLVQLVSESLGSQKSGASYVLTALATLEKCSGSDIPG